MFSVITYIYNKKTKGPTLMEFFTSVWQELEYRIDVCLVTRGVHIEHLLWSKKFSFSVAVNNSIKAGILGFLL
jgi:hypothetical protein